jgi:hypothetical protein
MRGVGGLIVLALARLSSSDSARSPGGDETDLATSAGATLDGGRLADMLVVTTTVGMFNGVHGHTTHLRPAVALCLVLKVRATRLQHGLVDSATASNNA